MTIVVRTRSTAARRRCAWCHDAAAQLVGRRCDDCATWLHGACWAEAGLHCPTRGCQRQRRAAPPPHTLRAPGWLLTVSVTLLFLFVLVGGAVTKFEAALDRGGPHTRKIDSDITAKINGG